MRRVIATVVGTVISLVLLLSFKTHSVTSSNAAIPPAVTTPSSAAPSTGTLDVPSVTPSAAASAATPAGSTSKAAKAAPTTTKEGNASGDPYGAGDAVDTRYGPVQVQVTLNGAAITDIAILQVPSSERRDVEINNYAVPILRDEALKAQGTQIDMVSGATYTSEGYLQSLQSALDKAK